MDRGKSTVAALDALVVDLLSLAQSSSREQEKTFATEALESLQRQCPMSMAVTLRHYSEVYQAAQAGAASAPRTQLVAILPCLVQGRQFSGTAHIPGNSNAAPGFL